MTVVPIDLVHLGLSGSISSYWVDGVEPMIVDPGPSTSLNGLERGLSELGVQFSDIRHLLLTHVHLDHAGGTGHLVSRFPDLQVHVHIDAAPHIVDPEKLVASTRRTFGEAHERLWGDVLPVPKDRICAWNPETREPVPGLSALSTPGHIAHHVSYLDEYDGVLIAGDALGVILAPGAPTHPPTPPPGVNVTAWLETLDNVQTIGPSAFGVSHFGLHDGFENRISEMRMRLLACRDRVASALSAGDEQDREIYETEVREVISDFRPRDEVEAYFDIFSPALDWDGMRFHLERTN